MSPRKASFDREEIVRIAFDMVRRDGWGNLTVPALAKAIHGSTMPIYSHFKNVGELQDAVVVAAVDFMYEYMIVEKTGDKWINHALRFVEFAHEEKHLYRCIFDARNVELQRKELARWNQRLLAHLTDYEAFKGFNDAQLRIIRMSRFMLALGIASCVNSGLYPDLMENLDKFVNKTSTALIDGLNNQFVAETKD